MSDGEGGAVYARFIVGDVFDGLASIKDGTVDLVVTSPPFIRLRSYLPADHSDKAKEIGQEATPAEFIDTLLRVTAELRRVLAPHGSICVELGDTYAGSGGAGGDYLPGGLRDGQQPYVGSAKWDRSSGRRGPGGQPYTDMFKGGGPGGEGWPLAKSKALIPELYRIALAYGINPLTGQESPAGQWRIRNVVTWCLDGDTVVYARTPKGEGPTRLLHLAQNWQPDQWELWDGQRWTKVLGWSSTEADDAIEIEFRNGEVVSATRNHEWPTQRGLVATEDLRIGDVVDTVTLPEPEPRPIRHLPDSEIGWFIGTYLADGSMDNRGRIQIAGHIDETALRLPRLQRLAESFDGTATAHHYGNTASIVVRSPVLAAVLARYLGGDSAANKRLRAAAWRRSNEFLQAVLLGYLEGDGHWDAKNQRWRLGFTDNPWLARDLRVIAARLGIRCKVKRYPRAADPRGGRFAGTARFYYRGEIRFEVRRDFAPTGQIVALRASKRRRFYDIGVEGEPHLFALGSGILTHNCRPNPPVGALGDKWRPATSDIVIACLSANRYWDDIATRYPSDYHRPNLRGKGSRATDVPGQKRNTSDHTVNPAGAPLLDWHSPLAAAIDRAAAEGFALGRHTTEPLFGEAKNEVKETIGRRMLRELVEQGAIDSGDVLYLPPGGYPGSHYAVYPPALVEPLIKAMAPPKVCRTCGEPSRRIVENAAPTGGKYTETTKGNEARVPGTGDRGGSAFPLAESVTLGWTDCGHDDWRPAVILDPFAGSGTTLAVATGHGHDAIGIDLDERNYELALERVGPLVLGPPEKPQPKAEAGS